MFVLDNPVQHYAWGSRTAIPELLGQTPGAEPCAELWMGAHPRAPSRVPGGRTLAEHIAADPETNLGGAAAKRFGGELPFLFKVLAAAQPLSIQAHPSEAQARAGFDREDAAGVPRDAAERNYRDPHHKPELLCALEPFEALCGFRPVDGTLALFAELGLVGDVQSRLASGEGLDAVFADVLRTTPAFVEDVVARARSVVAGPFAKECAWAVRLGEAYPGDPGVFAALLLNLVELEPGEAIYLGAGNLHAYLRGVGLELMANSDNVLRGGLTVKHVDVQELLRVVDFEPSVVAPLQAVGDGAEAHYETPAPEFHLSRVELDAPLSAEARGPEIWLCTEGSCEAGGVELRQGVSVFAPPGRYRVVPRPRAVVFRASVGALLP